MHGAPLDYDSQILYDMLNDYYGNNNQKSPSNIFKDLYTTIVPEDIILIQFSRVNEIAFSSENSEKNFINGIKNVNKGLNNPDWVNDNRSIKKSYAQIYFPGDEVYNSLHQFDARQKYFGIFDLQVKETELSKKLKKQLGNDFITLKDLLQEISVKKTIINGKPYKVVYILACNPPNILDNIKKACHVFTKEFKIQLDHISRYNQIIELRKKIYDFGRKQFQQLYGGSDMFLRPMFKKRFHKDQHYELLNLELLKCPITGDEYIYDKETGQSMWVIEEGLLGKKDELYFQIDDDSRSLLKNNKNRIKEYIEEEEYYKKEYGITDSGLPCRTKCQRSCRGICKFKFYPECENEYGVTERCTYSIKHDKGSGRKKKQKTKKKQKKQKRKKNTKSK